MRPKLTSLLVGLIMAFAVMGPATTFTAPPASAAGGPGIPRIIACALIPDPLVKALCINPSIIKVPGKIIGHVASAAVNGAITAWTFPLQEEGRFLGSGIVKMIMVVPPPNTQADVAFTQYENSLGLEYSLLGVFFLIGLLFCLSNPKRLLKLCSAALYAFIGGLVAPGIFEILIILSNEISKSVAVGSPADFSQNMGALFGANPGGPAAGGFFLMLFMLFFGGLLFWETVFRSIGIPVLDILVPLALLGLFLGTWGESKLRKLLFFILGLIVAQPLVVIVLNVGMVIGGSFNSTDALLSIVRAVFGVSIVALAAFLPFAIMTEAPIVGARLMEAGRSRSDGRESSASERSEEKGSSMARLVSKIPGVNNPLVPIAVGVIGTPAAGAAVAAVQDGLQTIAGNGKGGKATFGHTPPKVTNLTTVDAETGDVVSNHIKVEQVQSPMKAAHTISQLLKSMDKSTSKAA
jgi:hypothetical protein